MSARNGVSAFGRFFWAASFLIVANLFDMLADGGGLFGDECTPRDGAVFWIVA